MEKVRVQKINMKNNNLNIKKNTKMAIKFFFVLVFTLVIFTNMVLAITIENQENVPIEKNFIVGPAKMEINVAAGETKTIFFTVQNRTGLTQDFEISFEDFVGSANPGETVQLLGLGESSRTLKDYIFIEDNKFTLQHGDRAIVPVTISIPVGIPSGGRFASVIVSAVSKNMNFGSEERASTGAIVVGRIATLVFVTIPGEINPQGKLLSLEIKNNKKVFFGKLIPLRLVYENSGDVNLNPYGFIHIRNMFGRNVETKTLTPWFALPDSVRTRDVEIGPLLFGRYSALAQVNRGYGDIIDEQQVSFVVINPTIFILLVLIIIAVLVLFKRKMLMKDLDNHEI